VEYDLSLSKFLPRYKLQYRGIDAEAPFAAGCAVEDMSEVSTQFFGDDLDAVHAIAVVLFFPSLPR